MATDTVTIDFSLPNFFTVGLVLSFWTLVLVAIVWFIYRAKRSHQPADVG